MNLEQLIQTANALVAPAKGILAADESTGTIKRRFDAIGVENTEDNRRAYRELLFRTDNAAKYVSGVILFDETIRQTAVDGTPLVKLLVDEGIIPGIKVDTGAKPLAGSSGELVTEGLDGLRERLAEYYKLGARFSKWRAVITIGVDIPSSYCVEANAHALARFAALSQEAGLVPIVEPEVLMDGDHGIERCAEVTKSTIKEVFAHLQRHNISLEGMLLKPNMVLSGSIAKNRAESEEVAKQTVHCFKESIPSAIPGIVFLSGGQSDEEATINLNAINTHVSMVGAPWELSYSYGRGLQATAQKIWAGKSANVEQAQQAFLHRARLTSAARQGKYTPKMEDEIVSV